MVTALFCTLTIIIIKQTGINMPHHSLIILLQELHRSEKVFKMLFYNSSLKRITNAQYKRQLNIKKYIPIQVN